ncbi:MAG: DUF481 domain-containing protein [Verrucomicrobia bacterium]|nr:DUF481 domain-containing protein [Verrucomicrobiota bacterium]
MIKAAEPPAQTRDTLAFKDGDRVHGRLVRQEGGVLVFQSERFGEVRVPAADAVVIKDEKPAASKPVVAATPAPAAPSQPVAAAPAAPIPAPAAATATRGKAAEHDDEERVRLWERFSPSVLTAHVREFFGPWHGRLSFSTEVVTDIAERANNSYEALLRRKWPADEVQMTARYDYSQTNDIATTDLVKLAGQWRRDFSKVFFVQYRPTGEWNRASVLRGRPNDYVLLQQELGTGYQLVTRASRKARLGVSQNRFDTWNTAVTPSHVSRSVQSLFEETEFTLPWRITISQRGVWYPVAEQPDGWENRFDLSKKLTETLSTSLRHEVRRNNPDGTALDYTRLKLLFGLDF